MRYLRKYENHEDIHAICQKWGIKDYTINDDGFIDIDDSVNLSSGALLKPSDRKLEKLPLKFGDASGDFYCYGNRLTSLEGCPKSVGGDFYCYYNYLTNLEGCPKSVGGDFYCYGNRLTSLEGCSKSVGGNFICGSNRLMNLEGCPKWVGGSFYCRDNKIETFEGLDFIHIGDSIGWSFYCDENPIYKVWRLFKDHTKFEFFNDCDPIRENRVIILDRLNFFLDYIGKDTVTEVEGYKCI
jgi:hypothetical protein